MKKVFYYFYIIVGLSFNACSIRYFTLILSILFIANQIQAKEPFHHVNIIGGETPVAIALYQDSKNYHICTSKEFTKDSVLIKIKNDTLKINLRKHKNELTSVAIYSPEYKSISCAFVDSLYTCTPIEQDSLYVNITCNKYVSFNLNVKQAELMIINDSCTLEGKCDSLILQYLSKAHVTAPQLWVNDVKLDCYDSHLFLNVSNHFWMPKVLKSTVRYVSFPKLMEVNLLNSSLQHELYIP